MPLVYLAGGVTGLSGPAAMDWRVTASHVLLYAYKIESRDPLRDNDSLYQETTISDDFHAYEQRGCFYTSRAIMLRDFNDVKQSDVLLVNLLGATKPSLGTVMELGWAYSLQKPTVVVMETEGNPHDHHPMIHESIGIRVSTLKEGIRAVATILGRT